MRISEPHSNETYWGCLMLPILMHASEMNKASSRGKNNNNKRMKRGRRNQGGAQYAVRSLANARLLKRCPPFHAGADLSPTRTDPVNHKWEREMFCFQITPENLHGQRPRKTFLGQRFRYRHPPPAWTFQADTQPLSQARRSN